MSMEIPRRAQVDQWSPAERAIHDAVQAVEAMPADVRLTRAVVLLGEAQRAVADYLDGVMQEVAEVLQEYVQRDGSRVMLCQHQSELMALQARVGKALSLLRQEKP